MENSTHQIRKFGNQFKLNGCQLTNPSVYVGIDADPLTGFERVLMDYFDMSKTLGEILVPRKRRVIPKRKSLFGLLDVDVSSRRSPRIFGRTETIFRDEIEISEERIISKLLENDWVFKMPQRNKFTVMAKIVSIKKASPPIYKNEEK